MRDGSAAAAGTANPLAAARSSRGSGGPSGERATDHHLLAVGCWLIFGTKHARPRGLDCHDSVWWLVRTTGAADTEEARLNKAAPSDGPRPPAGATVETWRRRARLQARTSYYMVILCSTYTTLKKASKVLKKCNSATIQLNLGWGWVKSGERPRRPEGDDEGLSLVTYWPNR